jgi:hypothetical protein
MGLKYDINFFDPKHPVNPDTIRYNNVYKNVYGKILKTDKIDGETLIIRNNQVISSFYPFEKPAKSSARGDWYNYILINGIKSELEYDVNSSQNNEQDIAIGIQQNKNQYNDKDKPPKPLKRIIQEQRKNKTDEILQYFKNILEEKNNSITIDNNSDNSITTNVDTDSSFSLESSENEVENDTEVENIISTTQEMNVETTNEVENIISVEEANVVSTNEEENIISTNEKVNVETTNEAENIISVEEVNIVSTNEEENIASTNEVEEVNVASPNVITANEEIEPSEHLLNDIYDIFDKYNNTDLFQLMSNDIKNCINKYQL